MAYDGHPPTISSGYFGDPLRDGTVSHEQLYRFALQTIQNIARAEADAESKLRAIDAALMALIPTLQEKS